MAKKNNPGCGCCAFVEVLAAGSMYRAHVPTGQTLMWTNTGAIDPVCLAPSFTGGCLIKVGTTIRRVNINTGATVSTLATVAGTVEDAIFNEVSGFVCLRDGDDVKSIDASGASTTFAYASAKRNACPLRISNDVYSFGDAIAGSTEDSKIFKIPTGGSESLLADVNATLGHTSLFFLVSDGSLLYAISRNGVSTYHIVSIDPGTGTISDLVSFPYFLGSPDFHFPTIIGSTLYFFADPFFSGTSRFYKFHLGTHALSSVTATPGWSWGLIARGAGAVKSSQLL